MLATSLWFPELNSISRPPWADQKSSASRLAGCSCEQSQLSSEDHKFNEGQQETKQISRTSWGCLISLEGKEAIRHSRWSSKISEPSFASLGGIGDGANMKGWENISFPVMMQRQKELNPSLAVLMLLEFESLENVTSATDGANASCWIKRKRVKELYHPQYSHQQRGFLTLD